MANTEQVTTLLITAVSNDWQSVIDAVTADQMANIPAFANATLHKYAPWDPEEDQADGKIHLAMWPAPQGAEIVPDEMATMLDAFYQYYELVVWEATKTEGTRRVRDEPAAAALLQLENDVRGRLHLVANEQAGLSQQTHYMGTKWILESGKVRGFTIMVRAVQSLQYT